ncbi:MAG: hypothetical protein HGB11_09310 [Chlorobiales bacterium]|nr:hypothetical protein [Chlorobiales bacterium]
MRLFKHVLIVVQFFLALPISHASQTNKPLPPDEEIQQIKKLQPEESAKYLWMLGNKRLKGGHYEKAIAAFLGSPRGRVAYSL